VDEYDKPLLQVIGNESLQDAYRNTLKAFYGALKSCDRYIRFAFLTGVTKFGKVSVFSDLNNLQDISFDRRYTRLCGISEEELHRDFDGAVDLLARETGAPVSVISQGMGHTSERTTRICLSDLDNSVLDEACQRVVEAVFQKNEGGGKKSPKYLFLSKKNDKFALVFGL